MYLKPCFYQRFYAHYDSGIHIKLVFTTQQSHCYCVIIVCKQCGANMVCKLPKPRAKFEEESGCGTQGQSYAAKQVWTDAVWNGHSATAASIR